MDAVQEIKMSDEAAALWLIYGGWGVGKTYSLGTLPGRTMIVMSELKNIKRVIGWADQWKAWPLAVIDNGVIRNRTFDEFMEQMNKWLLEAQNGNKPFDNLCIDSLSELQALYGESIEDITHARRVEEGKKTNEIIDRYKKELAGFGTLNSVMGRTTKMLQKFTWYGINVVCTAGVPDVGDGWGEIKPYLIGKEYPSLLSGYFDFVGLVQAQDGKYPPVVRFESDGTFKAKCGDVRLAGKGGGPLNWSSIFKLLNNGKEE